MTLHEANGKPAAKGASTLATEMSVATSEFDAFEFVNEAEVGLRTRNIRNRSRCPEENKRNCASWDYFACTLFTDLRACGRPCRVCFIWVFVNDSKAPFDHCAQEVELVFGLKEMKALVTFSLSAEAFRLVLNFSDNGCPLLASCAPESGAFSAELFLSTMQTDPDAQARVAEREASAARAARATQAAHSQRSTQRSGVPDTQVTSPRGLSELSGRGPSEAAQFNDSSQDLDYGDCGEAIQNPPDFSGSYRSRPGDCTQGARREHRYTGDSASASGTAFDTSETAGADEGVHEGWTAGQGEGTVQPTRDTVLERASAGCYGKRLGYSSRASDEVRGGDHVGYAAGTLQDDNDPEQPGTFRGSTLPSNSSYRSSTRKRYDPADSFRDDERDSFDEASAVDANFGTGSANTDEDDDLKRAELYVEESAEVLVAESPALQPDEPSQSQSQAQGMASWSRRKRRNPTRPLLLESDSDNEDFLFRDTCRARTSVEASDGHCDDVEPRLSIASSRSSLASNSSAVAETPQKYTKETAGPSTVNETPMAPPTRSTRKHSPPPSSFPGPPKRRGE